MTNLEMYRGDTTVFDLTIARDGAPVDLTAAKIWMTARRAYGQSAYVFMKVTGAGIVITDAPGGLATVTLASSDTSSLYDEVMTLVYDVQVLESSGRLSTVAYGTLTVDPDVTRVTT